MGDGILSLVRFLGQVLKALQEAVSNHSLTVPPAPPTGTAPIARRNARVTPVHTFQVIFLPV